MPAPVILALIASLRQGCAISFFLDFCSDKDIIYSNLIIVLFTEVFMGWAGSALIVLGIWFVGDKNVWGFVFGATGNALWIYVGLKRGKQYDLTVVAAIATALNLVGLFKWMGAN